MRCLGKNGFLYKYEHEGVHDQSNFDEGNGDIFFFGVKISGRKGAIGEFLSKKLSSTQYRTQFLF